MTGMLRKGTDMFILDMWNWSDESVEGDKLLVCSAATDRHLGTNSVSQLSGSADVR